jgi:hypothetical protein
MLFGMFQSAHAAIIEEYFIFNAEGAVEVEKNMSLRKTTVFFSVA